MITAKQNLRKICAIMACAVMMTMSFVTPTYASLDDPQLPKNSIGEELYREALSHGVKGQVWITKDGNFGPVNHGHAGMLYAYAPYYIAFIEHRGAASITDYDTTYSQLYAWDWGSGDEHWKTVHTLRTYNVKTPNATAQGLDYDPLTMIAAADYAMANLLGYSYNPLAPKNSTSSVNCATIIYKAYINANVYGGISTEIGNDSSLTVIPKDLVEDTRLQPVFNAQWGGDQHTW